MVLPSAGSSISFSQINTELGRSSTATIQLDLAENGTYAAINQNSTSKPSATDPASMSEWYGYNHSAAPACAYSGSTPEYWWRADSGLSTSAWNGFAGGIDFTLFNVSSASSTTGILFNGSNGYGLTSNLGVNVDVKHVFLRFDSLVKPVGTLVALTGNTTNNIHEWPAYFNSGGFYFYYIENIAGTLNYANRGTVDTATTAIWADFANGGTSIVQYDNTSTTGNNHSAYIGTFNNRIRMPSGNGIYIGRRQEGNYANFYLKELALFTTALSQHNGRVFRDFMNCRWP